MSLRERLIAEIVERGPLRVSDYMDRCLHDPDDGYYARRPELGSQGDFITAPLVSQVFGELVGLWAIALWDQLGQPAGFRLVELGPGDGTMMSDVLRAARAAPAFLTAAEVWLVETSAPLRARQAANLAGTEINWANTLWEVPTNAPVIILANEFLDCLPIDQWIADAGALRERRVGVDAAGELAFVRQVEGGFSTVPGGIVEEHSAALETFGEMVGRLFTNTPGGGLFIDYGRDKPGPGDTLQALRGHRKESPLASPGHADLTALVDFPAFMAATKRGGADIAPLLTQAEFLRRMGIEVRASALARTNPAKSELITRQLQRLTSPAQMGDLFKVARVYSPLLATLPEPR